MCTFGRETGGARPPFLGGVKEALSARFGEKGGPPWGYYRGFERKVLNVRETAPQGPEPPFNGRPLSVSFPGC